MNKENKDKEKNEVSEMIDKQIKKKHVSWIIALIIIMMIIIFN